MACAAAHRRETICPYSTNLTDADWELDADLFERMPGQRGTPAHYNRRGLVNACSYVLRTSDTTSAMPMSKPPRNLSANASGSDNVYRMTRPLRLEFPGALYQFTSRGDRRGTIYRDDTDRLAWQEVLALVCERYHFVVHNFCQMSNHYHLLVETVEANLSQGTRQLNGVYTQHFNRRHKLVGHVLQGRYQAILVQQENYLLELARYIVLNPVRAHMVVSPDDWY